MDNILVTTANLVLNKMDSSKTFDEDMPRINVEKSELHTNHINFLMDEYVIGRASFEIKVVNHNMMLPNSIRTQELEYPNCDWKTLDELDSLADVEDKAFTKDVEDMPEIDEDFMHAVNNLAGDKIWQGMNV